MISFNRNQFPKTKEMVIESIRFTALGIPYSVWDYTFDYVRVSRSGSDICVIGIISDEEVNDRGYFVHNGLTQKWEFGGWGEEGAGMTLGSITDFQEKDDLVKLAKNFDNLTSGLLSD